MKKKNTIILVTIILFLVGILITIKIVSDFNKEKKINQEIKEIIKYYEKSSYNDENLKKILDRKIIEKGPYSEVEKSIKQYYKDLTQELSNLDFLLSKDNFSSYITTKNITEDRPTFIKSKERLENTKNQINSVHLQIDKLLNDKYEVMSYIANKEVKKYYKDYYFSLVKNYLTSSFSKNITSKKDMILNNIDIYEEIFDYLISTKGNWKIEDNTITFKNIINQDEYNNILKKIKEVS
jgi:hypothetical protein